MRSKFMTFIISTVFILSIAVFILFGAILWDEFLKLETSVEPTNVQTVISENQDTIDEDIKAPEIIEDPLEQIVNEDDKNQEEQKAEEIDYSNITINKYFYNQLEQYSNALETNKENMKIGNYKIELGNIFSLLLEQNNGKDELGKYYQSAIEAYTYDNPDVFYLSPNKMYLNIETTTRGNNVTYNVYINSGNEENYFIDEFSSKAQIDNVLEQIEDARDEILSNKSDSTYENIKMIHDYLIDNLEYDTSISKDNIYNIYGAMVNKVCVCEGYARSFKYLMDYLEIPCTIIIGKGLNSENKTENHAWNYVQLDGNWYAIDCTWDDPVSSTGWVSESSKTKYFLKGSNTMSHDHNPNPQFTDGGKVFNYPQLSKYDYN